MAQERFEPCPLCKTPLPYEKWLEVVGVYEEQQKHKKQLESELNKAKEQSKKRAEEYKKLIQEKKSLREKYKQDVIKEREKNKALSESIKEKGRILQKKLETQFNKRQSKLKDKYEREKRAALARVKTEGIKIGAEKEKSKAEKLKTALIKLKENHAIEASKLDKQHQKEKEQLKRRLENEKRSVLKEGINKGIEKQKAKTEKVSKMADKLRKDRDEANERIKQLEEMIKKGTTPQIEGFDFEKEFAGQLKARFPEDEIKLTGKKGDIIQTVIAEDKKVGKILYECKKTKDFLNKYIDQIIRDKAKTIANFGVIVTSATKDEKQGFWMEKDIFIVHPYGALDIAIFLRETLIQLYTLKISKSDYETKGKALIEFMQSEDFRTRIQDSINKSREAYEILKKEIKTHVNTWKRRTRIYDSIHKNSGIIQNAVRYILLHGKTPAKLTEGSEFPALPMLIEKTKNL